MWSIQSRRIIISLRKLWNFWIVRLVGLLIHKHLVLPLPLQKDIAQGSNTSDDPGYYKGRSIPWPHWSSPNTFFLRSLQSNEINISLRKLQNLWIVRIVGILSCVPFRIKRNCTPILCQQNVWKEEANKGSMSIKENRSLRERTTNLLVGLH